jgi:hypothetical protein
MDKENTQWSFLPYSVIKNEIMSFVEKKMDATRAPHVK